MDHRPQAMVVHMGHHQNMAIHRRTTTELAIKRLQRPRRQVLGCLPLAQAMLLPRQHQLRTTVQQVATTILQLNLVTLRLDTLLLDTLRLDMAPAMMFRAIRPMGLTHRRTTAAHRLLMAADIRLQAIIHLRNMVMGRLPHTHILMATVPRLAMATMATREGAENGQAAA